MKFKIGQHVTYEGRRWIVYEAHTNEDGQTTYFLKRGYCRTTAKEEELSE